VITKDTIIQEVVQKHPQAVGLFEHHGLHCLGWGGALFETIEQGARMHGVDLDKLMKDLNALEKDK